MNGLEGIDTIESPAELVAINLTVLVVFGAIPYIRNGNDIPDISVNTVSLFRAYLYFNRGAPLSAGATK